MNENATSLILYPSKRKTVILLLTSLLFTLGGAWMIHNGEPMGWFALIFFGIGCIVFIVTLLPRRSYLRLSEQGFEMRSLFGGGFINWSEVDHFRPGYIGPNKVVFLDYSQEHKKYKMGKQVVKSMTGAEGSLPDTYGKSAEELAILLNEWRERFSKT